MTEPDNGILGQRFFESSRTHRFRRAIRSAILFGALVGLGSRSEALEPRDLPRPRGLEDLEVPVPAGNPQTPSRIALGRTLFFDARLSEDGATSCASCHVPESGWADPRRFSPKPDGTPNVRNTPSLYGVAFAPRLGWDGASATLEERIAVDWRDQLGADPASSIRAISRIASYRSAFRAAFGGAPSPDSAIAALAGFVRTIEAGDTAWDLSPQADHDFTETPAGRGYRVFVDVARCAQCHLPPLYTDGLFHRIGIGPDQSPPDLGRAGALDGEKVPADPKDVGAFRTPSLRGVTRTAPYFHDGRISDWKSAVSVMLAGGDTRHPRDERLRPRPLTPEQKRDLFAFLESLDPGPPTAARPTAP